MPFTPFHMGPGMLLKALLQGSFSLMVFGWAQILMDIQPLVVMLTGEGHLHGFSHTYVGATLIGLAAALTGKYAAEWGLRIIREERFLPLRWPVTVVSALIGAYSHVVIDSIMHADMEPFAPWSSANDLLSLLPIDVLHWVCIGSGVVGLIIYLAVTGWHKRAG